MPKTMNKKGREIQRKNILRTRKLYKKEIFLNRKMVKTISTYSNCYENVLCHFCKTVTRVIQKNYDRLNNLVNVLWKDWTKRCGCLLCEWQLQINFFVNLWKSISYTKYFWSLEMGGEIDDFWYFITNDNNEILLNVSIRFVSFLFVEVRRAF